VRAVLAVALLDRARDHRPALHLGAHEVQPESLQKTAVSVAGEHELGGLDAVRADCLGHRGMRAAGPVVVQQPDDRHGTASRGRLHGWLQLHLGPVGRASEEQEQFLANLLERAAELDGALQSGHPIGNTKNVFV
jgi:hypothetical protein